jgi:hypothetical protein
MTHIDEDKLTADYVSVAIVGKKENLEEELDMLFNKKTSVSAIVEKFSLKRDDFSIWSNYGNDNWLVIEKAKVDDTYFQPRTFLFLDNVVAGNKIDFGDSVYQITSVVKNPSVIKGQEKDFTWLHIRGTYIKKDGTLGKRTVYIQHLPTILNNAVEIDFSR